MSFITTDVKEKGNLVEFSGFPIAIFVRDIKKFFSARVVKFFQTSFIIFGRGTIKIHKSFLPEMIYILEKLPQKPIYSRINNLIFEKTWMSNILKAHPNRIKTSLFSDFNYNLKGYQKNFLNLYDEMKQKYFLKGYVLAFEQGLGKTFTSLALMHGLQKESVLIVAPKSTLKTVWRTEIEAVFKTKQDIWIVGQPPRNARFYIVNYESIDKLKQILKFVIGKRVGIIVDESHNFRNVGAQRVIRLQSIAKATKCQDILLMSGTPIKALGSEMIPTMELLDPFFDNLARRVFLAAFGVNIPVALDILKNRLGLMMHRKTKEEVLKLPSKSRKELKIKISNGNEFTLESVKKKVLKFMEERKKYYELKRTTFESEYQEVINFLKQKLSGNEEFENYLKTVNYLKKYGYSVLDRELVERVSKANKYEKKVLRPMLPNDLKKKFDRSKAVVKYVDLKIMGEVLGGLLNRLRAQMFSDMIKKSPLCKLIEESEKKTVCFSTFVDVVKNADDFLRSNCKKDPILVFGETSSAVTSLLKNFKVDSKRNPLVATIQTLSTGVTLTEANTVIFLNKPWRHVDISQAEDRVHRIGQDTDVKIFTFTLDTGSKPNLSTRMDDIIAWSKEMFTGIVGDETQTVNKTIRIYRKFLLR